MPKPLSKEQEKSLRQKDPKALISDTLYLISAEQLRAQLQNPEISQILRREDVPKLRDVVKEHHEFRRDLRNRHLL